MCNAEESVCVEWEPKTKCALCEQLNEVNEKLFACLPKTASCLQIGWVKSSSTNHKWYHYNTLMKCSVPRRNRWLKVGSQVLASK